MPLNKVPRVWVVVADGHRLRVFNRKGEDVSLVEEMVPEASEEEGLTNKGVGRVAGSSRGAVHHKYEPRMDASQKEELSFARDIAAYLDTQEGKNAFDRLVLVAAPHMLGELRKILSKKVCGRISAEVSKDLTKMNERALQEELKKILWF